MLTPTFRFVALPLAAIVALAALSMQPAASKAPRELSVREQVLDCSAVRDGDVCVIGHGT
jgi:hypothetical protein